MEHDIAPDKMRHNPRVLTVKNQEEAVAEMRAIGVGPSGVEIMSKYPIGSDTDAGIFPLRPIASSGEVVTRGNGICRATRNRTASTP